LMSLLEEYIAKEAAELREQGVAVHVLGERARLAPGARSAVDRVERDTRGGQRLALNLCISYSSRAELARAARLLAEEVLKGTKRLEDIDEEAVRAKLYTAPWSDPDLLIRTSGELRISNFLLWQLAYTELYMTPVLWLLAVLVVAAVRGPARRRLRTVSVTVFGSLYASALLAFTVAIRHGPHRDAHPRGSVALALLPLVVTWVCDTCAMAAGTLIGGPKLTPVLSPHKTWAGAVGGVVGGLIAALLYGPLVLNRLGLQLSVLQLVTVGAVVAVSAQVGDVAESLLKREAGVKDSSALIPGHG